MKKFLFLMLAATFMWCGRANAQKVLLPYGQNTLQPWTGKYFFAEKDAAGPTDDWFGKSFDDSSWGTVEGPISSVAGSIAYYNTVWQAEYGTYWVRRHFTVGDISQIRELYFYTSHDDGCVAYLNGKLIYETGNVYSRSVLLSDEVRGYLTEGDNLLAIRVSDTNGSYAYLDCGLYGYSLINSTFDNGSGWTGAYDRYGYDGNNMGYRYGQTFRCEQTIENAATGLYCLSANACGMEYYNDQKTALAHQKDELPAKLFVGTVEKAIPSAFTEPWDTDLGYCWNIDGKFVPYYVDRTPWAFKRAMYHCELWTFAQPDANGKLTVGIYGNAANDISRWAAWDNLDITYYSESDVNTMLADMITVFTELNAKPQNADVKKHAAELIAAGKAATGYEGKGAAFADIMQYEPIVRKSIKAYEALNDTLSALNTKLAATTAFTSPATIAEATALSNEVKNAHSNGSYDNDDVAAAINKMNKMIERLGYTYVDITVNVPGAMGDSILSKVENFVDVVSIKLSGTLNDADINTLQTRLTQLREIDMTGVKMTVMPNNFFYQRKLLEIVKLPVELTTIGEYAFYQCYGLKHMDFPATLTTIKSHGFSECDNLLEVILPEGLTTLGDAAFYSCDNNLYVKLPSTLTVINGSTFAYNYKLAQVDFAEGLTHIYGSAFYDCYELNHLKFPNTLYYIGDNSFAYNHALSDLQLNEGLYQIADNAFYDCDALTEVTLPSSLVRADYSPFDYCDNLMKVTCLSIEPPYMVDQIPYGLGMEGRELYVPELSINVYKQTTGWDKFQTIKPIDYLPENIAVVSNLKLTLPETIPAEYKPNVTLIHDQKGTSYWQYGSLTVNGEGTLSMSDFSMFWDPNYQYDQYNRVQNYCSLVNNSHLRADQVYIDLYNRNDIWTFLTMPFDVKLSEIETYSEGTTNWIVRKYDGQKRAQGEATETWTKLSGDDVINAGEGFIIQGSRYIDNNRQAGSGFRMKAINNANKNNIFRTTDITVALNEYESEFAHNRSWNFIGNPYPSYYDTRFMDFEAPITVWNMRNSTYTAYSPADDAYILCPGEAFFVQRPIANGNIVFSKEGRQTDRNARTLDAQAIGRRVSDNQSVRTIINLSITNDKSTDRTRVVLNGQATMQYELDKDASKFVSTDPTVPQIYTIDNGVNYAINERPVADGNVILATYAGAEDFYTITLDNDVEGCQVALEDKAEGKTVVLTKEAGYTFSSKAGTFADRFVLHLTGGTTGIQTIDNEQSTMNNAVYDLQGRKLSTVFATPHSQGENSQLSTVKRGIYIKNGKKIILNK